MPKGTEPGYQSVSKLRAAKGELLSLPIQQQAHGPKLHEDLLQRFGYPRIQLEVGQVVDGIRICTA